MIALQPHPDTPETPAELAVEDLQALITSVVAQLVDPADWARPKVTTLNLLGALADTHQRGLGWLTPDAARVMDDLLVKERYDHLRNLQEGVKITGATPAPASIPVLALLADLRAAVWETLATFARATRLAHTPLCLLPHRHDLPFEDQLRLVADTAHHVDHVGVLRDAHARLEDLATAADNLIDPPMQARHPGHCPWCHRASLVIHMRDLFVQCEQDPDTGRREPCICSDSMCPCKSSPIGFRHTWTNKGHGSTSLRGLARAQRDIDDDTSSSSTTSEEQP